MFKKKIILFEGELKGGKGHHYDHLVENSFYYKDRGEIIWVVNKKFNKKDLFIPDFVKVLNIIDTADRKIVSKNFKFNIELFYLPLKNFFKSCFFLLAYIRFNFNFLSFIFRNFFCFPKYFSSFYKTLKNLNLGKDDKIIFQTSRINDFELVYALTLLNCKSQLHLRIIQLHRKKKFRKFQYILKILNDKNELYSKVFVYTETEFQKQEIKKHTNIDVDLFYNNLSFSQKIKKKDKLTIGILGESRYDKGFYKTPELIRILNNQFQNEVNFIIQINNCPSSLLETKNDLERLSKEFGNIRIINGYINFFEYREILKLIDIIPLLHELDQLKNCGSGIVFSSMVNEIPMVIPKGAKFVKSFFKYDSYLEAESIDDYSKSIEKIIKNYPKFLEMAKKQSKLYLDNLNQDFLNNRI